MAKDTARTLIDALQRGAVYPHSVTAVRMVETHISWVLLTGSYAYKIKKPVDLGFLDFTTLAQRRHYCEEEVRLNGRLAPELYLGVVAIHGRADAPSFADENNPIEYAVKMHEFPEEAQLDRVLARGELTRAHVTAIAETLARFHSATTVADVDTSFGTPDAVWQPMAQNFLELRTRLQDPAELELLAQLERWSEERRGALHDALLQRKYGGYIRECHGDVHLGNIVLLDGKPLLFDCIEFNPGLRWIDVISEIAFLTMDIHGRGRSDLAHRVLNDYLQATTDYDALHLLRFYQVYRALVRAKVACLRLAQNGLSNPQRTELARNATHYLRLAARMAEPTPTPLMITHGLSGSGKTTVTNEVLESQGALRLRSDVERKRLFGLTAETRTSSAVNSGLYSAEASDRTYRYMAAQAEKIIRAGFPVLIDAAFLKRSQRDLFRRLAQQLNTPFVIFECKAPAELLRERVAERATAARDASEATVAVLEQQLQHRDPLSNDEAVHIFAIETGSAPQ